jgi:transcriptional regulator with XRE-family HTH domain
MPEKQATSITLGSRIKRLRQERSWSQAQLGKRLGVHQKQISGYERGIHFPQTDLLIRVAELFDVSLDFLAFDGREDTDRVRLADRELLERFEQIDQLSEADRATVKAVLDTFILKSRFQKLASVAPAEESPALKVASG